MTTGMRIKGRRKQLGLPAEYLADQLGISPATVYRYEKGDIEKVPSQILPQLAAILQTTPAYLMGWTEDPSPETSELLDTPVGPEGWEAYPKNLPPMPPMHRIPLVGTIACGTPITAEQNIEGYVSVDGELNCQFALRCKGDSMAPRVINGDLVYIRQQPDVNDGQIAAVLIDGEATLKHVYHLPDGVQLVSDNPAYRPLIYTGEACAGLRIIGLAVAYQRML